MKIYTFMCVQEDGDSTFLDLQMNIEEGDVEGHARALLAEHRSSVRVDVFEEFGLVIPGRAVGRQAAEISVTPGDRIVYAWRGASYGETSWDRACVRITPSRSRALCVSDSAGGS